MRKEVHVAILDGVAANVTNMERVIRRSGIPVEVTWIRNSSAFMEALRASWPGVIIAGSSIRGFNVAAALRSSVSLREGLPVIVVSESEKDQRATKGLRSGVGDYIVNARVLRLGTAVKEAISAKRNRGDQKGAEKKILLPA